MMYSFLILLTSGLGRVTGTPPHVGGQSTDLDSDHDAELEIGAAVAALRLPRNAVPLQVSPQSRITNYFEKYPNG